MEVKETQATDWKPVNLKFAQAQYPQPINPHLPRHCAVAILAGSRNSGKTFSLCEWIKTQEDTGVVDKRGRRVGVRTILISPTAQMNPVYQSLKSLAPEDIHTEYSDELFLDIVEDIKAQKQASEDYDKDMELYRKMLKMKRESDLDFDELMRLNMMGFEEPQEPPYYHCITNLVFDDVIGTSATRDGKKSPVINFTIKNRHHLCQVYFLSQSLKSIPKPIRTNANVYMLYPFANSKMVADDMYPEVSNLVKNQEAFMKLYEYATQPDEKLSHPFLMIDFTKSKDKTFRKGFNRYLSLN